MPSPGARQSGAALAGPATTVVPMSAPSQRRRKGRPRTEDAPASLDTILGAALRAFATHGYDRVSPHTLNRELGASHNLLHGRFGSKEALWHATFDWAFQPLALRLATAFNPPSPIPLSSCGS
jgi:AcrR family transcriptional regulator